MGRCVQILTVTVHQKHLTYIIDVTSSIKPLSGIFTCFIFPICHLTHYKWLLRRRMGKYLWYATNLSYMQVWFRNQRHIVVTGLDRWEVIIGSFGFAGLHGVPAEYQAINAHGSWRLDNCHCTASLFVCLFFFLQMKCFLLISVFLCIFC